MTEIRKKLEEELKWETLDTRDRIQAVIGEIEVFNANAKKGLKKEFVFTQEYYERLSALEEMTSELIEYQKGDILHGCIIMALMTLEGHKNIARIALDKGGVKCE